MFLNCGKARFSACLGRGSSGLGCVLTRTETLLELIDRYPVVTLDSHSKAGCVREARQRAIEAWAANITLEPTRMEKACQKGTEAAGA